MTDLARIKERVDGVAHEFALGIEGRSSFGFFAAEAMPKLFERIDALQSELATLKASGTFTDRVEAAAKAVRAKLEFYTEPYDNVLHALIEDIEALSSQQNAQRERELAFLNWLYHTGKLMARGHSYQEILEAFDGSQS